MYESWDSAFGIATGYGLDDRGGRSSSLSGDKHFHFPMSSKPALGPTQPHIQWVTGGKLPGHEANQSHPTSAEVKKMWVYTFTPPYAFMA
jgi:hypothetical protein